MPVLRPPAPAVLLHHHQQARGQPPICARLRVNSVAQCIRLRSCASRPLEEAPSMPALRPPAPSVRALDALHRHQRARGQPPICACLRSNSAAVHPSAVCVRQHSRRKRHQCPFCVLQRRPLSACVRLMLCMPSAGQRSAACLRPPAVCVLHGWRNRATMIHENSIIRNYICENSLIKKLLTFART